MKLSTPFAILFAWSLVLGDYCAKAQEFGDDRGIDDRNLPRAVYKGNNGRGRRGRPSPFPLGLCEVSCAGTLFFVRDSKSFLVGPLATLALDLIIVHLASCHC